MKLSALAATCVVVPMLTSSCCFKPCAVDSGSQSSSPRADAEAGARLGQPPGGSNAQDPDAAPAAPKSLKFIAAQNPLPVVPRDQEGYSSCWAAVTEMIVEFLEGGRVRQCEQATAAFNEGACCNLSGDLLRGNPHCDWPWFPEFNKWGFDFEYHFEQPLSWEEVKDEIDAGRPFAFSWKRVNSASATAAGNAPSGGVGHMLVVIGYNMDANGLKTVTCIDPAPNNQTDVRMEPLANYNESSGLYTHRDDYFMIRPRLLP